MKRPTRLRERAWPGLALLLTLAVAASCGGGAGEGVVGSGGTGVSAGLAIGTVNGFGSVIVDGVSYDNRTAPVVAEIAPGQDVVAEIKLGNRVSVDYEAMGVARLVRVEAALSGALTSAVSKGQFAMLGQTVVVNSSGASGPITQFGGGYGQAADLHVGDAVEVNGVLVRRDDGYLVQATRIDKLASAPAYLRVTGLVSELGAEGAMQFALGALSVDARDAPALPASTALANGQMVTVLALPQTLKVPSAGTWRLQAAQIRIRELPGGSSVDDYVSGSISHLDAQARTMSLGSLRVNYAAAVLAPAMVTLANGQYALVRGKVGADGALVASTVTIRDGASDSEAELRGNVVAYDAVSGGFSVRGVTVDASGAKFEDCPAAGLADGVYVEIEGSLSSTAVLARKVHCESEPAGASVEREGVAQAVDVAGMSFSLAREHGAAVKVRWTATTFFGGVQPQSLAGKSVHVEGSLVGDVLVASKVKHDD